MFHGHLSISPENSVFVIKLLLTDFWEISSLPKWVILCQERNFLRMLVSPMGFGTGGKRFLSAMEIEDQKGSR